MDECCQMIHRFGKEIDHTDSICYWAYKNNIPIFCPPITDGAIGDNMFFHSFKNPGLRCDIIEDVKLINMEALNATPKKTGMIILGGGTMNFTDKNNECCTQASRDKNACVESTPILAGLSL